MKKKALAFAAAACAFGMLLSGCGSSNGSDTAAEGANIITAYNSEPQNPLIPGSTPTRPVVASRLICCSPV